MLYWPADMCPFLMSATYPITLISPEVTLLEKDKNNIFIAFSVNSSAKTKWHKALIQQALSLQCLVLVVSVVPVKLLE